MTSRNTNKWAEQIIGLQCEDGSWGNFHTLSQPTKARPITTEQALRRLRILGFTKEDNPIKKALVYMRECLTGGMSIPDNREKVINWDAFEAHMLATWVLLFTPDDPPALKVAKMWSEIVSASLNGGVFDEAVYENEYRLRIPVLHKGERLILPAQFYMVNLLKGALSGDIENRFLDCIINGDRGIYYIYPLRISNTPSLFASRVASHYVAALEQIAGYTLAGEKLTFAKNWIISNKDADGGWDMGPAARDGVYFPLSDSWRKLADRKRDCTHRIKQLLNKLGRADDAC